jgi:hypothetical protein
MPKIGQTKCINNDAHHEAITTLLNTIAKRGGKRRGDVIIAYEEDISVYAVRMWLTRPIPKKHWKTVARLSGYSLERVEKVATQHFVTV